MFVLSRSLASLHRALHTPLAPNMKQALSDLRLRLREVLNSFRRVKEFRKEFRKELSKELSPATTASPKPRTRPSGQRRRFCKWNVRVICSSNKQHLAVF